jgi:hypothetical protein
MSRRDLRRRRRWLDRFVFAARGILAYGGFTRDTIADGRRKGAKVKCESGADGVNGLPLVSFLASQSLGALQPDTVCDTLPR